MFHWQKLTTSNWRPTAWRRACVDYVESCLTIAWRLFRVYRGQDVLCVCRQRSAEQQQLDMLRAANHAPVWEDELP